MPAPIHEQVPAALAEINEYAGIADTDAERAEVDEMRNKYEGDRAVALAKLGQSATGGELHIDERGMVATNNDQARRAKDGPDEPVRGWR